MTENLLMDLCSVSINSLINYSLEDSTQFSHSTILSASEDSPSFPLRTRNYIYIL